MPAHRTRGRAQSARHEILSRVACLPPFGCLVRVEQTSEGVIRRFGRVNRADCPEVSSPRLDAGKLRARARRGIGYETAWGNRDARPPWPPAVSSSAMARGRLLPLS